MKKNKQEVVSRLGGFIREIFTKLLLYTLLSLGRGQ